MSSTPPPELVSVRCPCRCKSTLLFRKIAAGSTVRCPHTAHKFKLLRWQPFGRKPWDDCRELPVLRQALAILKVTLSVRKRRLLAVAIGRACLDWCHNPHFLGALAAGEAHADGEPLAEDVTRLATDIIEQGGWTGENWSRIALKCLELSPGLEYGALESTYGAGVWLAFKDIIPNPFRPPSVDAGHRTATVLGLAETAYADRAFGHLPILADALEDVGCTDVPLLAHLRADTPHHRGCWALDAVLGRS